MLYSDEVWTGIEYQVAAPHDLRGHDRRGLRHRQRRRDRYDGIPRPPIGRNPWNEIECGGHYARAMSSWSLLLAASGYEYDGVRQVAALHAAASRPSEFQGVFLRPGGLGQPAHKPAKPASSGTKSAWSKAVCRRPTTLGPAGRIAANESDPRRTAVDAAIKPQPDGVLVTFAVPLVIKAGETLTIAFD